MREMEFLCEESGVRIDAWISKIIQEYSRSYIQKLIEEGNVFVNDNIVKSNYKVKPQDMVKVNIPEPQLLQVNAEQIDIKVLYEDDHIMVVDKPKGMVVHPAAGNYSGTLVNALMGYCKDNLSDINGVIRPGIVHRIDKDTSGVLVVAKSNKAHEILSDKLKTHDIKRVYVALVHGTIREDNAKIDAPIGRHPVERKKMSVNIKNGRNAVTYFNVIERYKNGTYIEVTLETGRTHQIRVHMSYIGYPVIDDKVYGRKSDKFNIDGQALHAKILGFNHPVTNEYMEFESEVPKYFEDVINELKSER